MGEKISACTNKRGLEGIWCKGGTEMKEVTKLIVEYLMFLTYVYGADSGIVGKGTVLQVGRLRV